MTRSLVRPRRLLGVGFTFLLVGPVACFAPAPEADWGTGGATGGGAPAGGGVLVETGGAPTGGVPGGGGAASGGVGANGGAGVGGASSGGAGEVGGTAAIAASGGWEASGGAGTGGVAAGGAAVGGTSGGVAGGAPAGGGAPSDGGAGQASGGASSEPVFHVFLLLGQSNMAGFPKASAQDKTPDPRVLVLGYDDCAASGRREGDWAVAVPPLHECWGDALGPGDYFAKTILPHFPEQDTIGLVPLAISGERVETFMKGGSKYAWVLERGRAAWEAGGVIEGILFHQGESNCQDSSWPGLVKQLVTDLRSELDLGPVPFLAGELLYGAACDEHNKYVNQLPDLIPEAYAISAQGLSLDPADTWNAHFDHDSQVTLGQRYAETMIEALGL